MRYERDRDNVIPFGRTNGGPRITQQDLAEEALLRKRRREISREHKRKRNEIIRALEDGAEVEPGLREVEFATRKTPVFR